MKKFAREIFSIVLIILGILSAGIGLKGFLLCSRFIDGVTSVSMLISQIFGLPLAIFILIFNLPFIALGYKQVSKIFALKSALAIGGYAPSKILIKTLF